MSLPRNTSHHLHCKKRPKRASPLTGLCAITHVAHQFGSNVTQRASGVNVQLVKTGRRLDTLDVWLLISASMWRGQTRSHRMHETRHLEIQSLALFLLRHTLKSTQNRSLDVHVTPAPHYSLNVCMRIIRHIHEEHVSGSFHHFHCLCLAPSGSKENKENRLVVFIDYIQRQTPEMVMHLPHLHPLCPAWRTHAGRADVSWCDVLLICQQQPVLFLNLKICARKPHVTCLHVCVAGSVHALGASDWSHSLHCVLHCWKHMCRLQVSVHSSDSQAADEEIGMVLKQYDHCLESLWAVF